MKKKLLCSIAAASMIYSGHSLAQNAAGTQSGTNACDRLAGYMQENRDRELGFDERQLNAWRNAGDTERCDGILRQIDAQARTGDDGRIVVEQAAPQIRIDQSEPRIVVRQSQPDVNVTQGQPEILVRQPAPQVTVSIPQPEIIVRMPESEVAVSQNRPQVSVSQPEPDVAVVQPEQQARVLMEQDEQPQVQLQQPGEPNVQVSSAGEPNVRYEAEDPQVRIQREQGEPTVRYERAADAGAAGAEGVDRRQTAQRPGLASEDAARRTEQAFSDADRRNAGQAAGETTGAVGDASTRMISLDDLEGMDVVNARGVQLGDVENVVIDPGDGRQLAVIAHGGFLGLGEKKVALPLENMVMTGERLVIRGVTEDEIRAMPAFDDGDRTYRALGAGQQAEVEISG